MTAVPWRRLPALRLPDPPLRGQGVLLRPWIDHDAPWALEGNRDPLVQRYARVPQGQTLDALRSLPARHKTARDAGEALRLAIADETSDAFLGSIGLVGFDWEDSRAEITCWLRPSARGRGVMTTALLLVSRWALCTLPLVRLDFRVDASNGASQAVAQRAGFVREGVLRSYTRLGAERSDIVVFSLLQSDPAPPAV
jgi:ribosomal-protein-alanine N-acetyltransferase